MTPFTFTNAVLLPLGLGLLGFVEPCSLGSTLIIVTHLEGKSAASKLAQVSMFAGTRAIFVGLLGVLAAVLGTAFVGLQRGAWIALGMIYVLLGLLYVAGKAGILMVAAGPTLMRLSSLHGSASLGVLFGLNVPACAAPLVLALLSAAAAGGATGETLTRGFVSLALFGLALSLPLVMAVLFEPARRLIDWLGGFSRRLPVWTGVRAFDRPRLLVDLVRLVTRY